MRIVPRWVSIMRPTMARPKPVPLALVVLNTAVNARFCNSSTHALAGVLEFHRNMGWLFTGARRADGLRFDSERASLGHRFRGIEDQIQKDLFQLRCVAHDQRQIRRQLANQFDILIGQFMTHEQAEFVNQFVQIHRRELRFGRAGKRQDPLHDFVQVFDFGINQPGILGARIAVGKLQSPANGKAISSP